MSNITFEYKIIIIASLIVWIFPAINQYKEKYFGVILVLAIFDPIHFIILYFSNYYVGTIQPLIVSAVLAILVLDKSTIKSSKIIITLAFIVNIVLLLIMNSKNLLYVYIIILQIFIFYKFLGEFYSHLVKHKLINLFYLLLVFYFILNIFKVNNLLFQFTNAFLFHYITSLFQILIGIYFSLVKESSPKNLINFTKE